MILGPPQVMISSFVRREPPPARCADAADMVEAVPVEIVGDADAARSSAALAAPLADSQKDAVLVLNVPTALASARATADAVAAVAPATRTVRPKPVLAVWIGADAALWWLPRRDRPHCGNV
jgi:hypothetical protein